MASFLEDGDDFSNNLASDIAPLLALFGESVTTQFMSQSTGWADCIMLAMAPIGVITVIVSAIRVGGYTWLKAVVGRARENIVAAELEVMSSTSKEACELWNGRNVVRCPGAADICEFICLYPTETKRKDITSARIMDIEKATSSNEDHAKDSSRFLLIRPKKRDQYFPGLSARFRKIKRRFLLYGHGHKHEQEESSDKSHIDDVESGQSSGPQQQSGVLLPNSVSKENTNQRSSNASPNSGTASQIPGLNEIVILRNRTHPAPNISLNCQADGHRWPIWLCAAITVVLQAGALLYFGFVTEYHTLKFEKEGEPVQDYTMPLAVTGTVFLVLGMLLCGHVVNKASEETRWELNDGKHHAISMIWLQKRKQVSDQQFESKAIFPEKKRNQFVISARAIGVEQDDAGQSSQPGTRREGQSSPPTGGGKDSNPKEEETSLVRWLQILSFFGVFISLAGSVCQFTGLRGMHWTASIAQLGAVALATFVRAVVRRALTHDIKQQNLMPGYELDWFVMSLSNMQTAVWFPPENKSAWERFCSKVVSAFGWVSCKLEALFGQSDNGCQNTSQPAEKNEESCFWTIETGLPAFETRTGSIERTGDQKIRQYRQVDGIHTAQGILNLRRYLGELGNWKSPVFAEAVALSKAIEITMGYFEDHLKNPNTECFTWKMQVKVGYDKKAVLGYLGAYGRLRLSNARRVEFNVEKKADGWKARIDELDAALSLWLYSVHSSKGNRDEANRTAFPSGDDQWLRGKKVKEQCLHVIGPFSPRLVQDLEWWIPNGLEGIKTSGPPKRDEKVDKNSFPHDVWIERIGRAGLRSPKSSNGQFSKRLSIPMDGNITHWNWKPTESSDLSGGDTEEKPTDDHLIVESQNTLARLYATDMFTSFVWALAEQLEPLSVNQKVKATVQLGDTTGREAWKNFTLRSPWLSRLVQTIVELGSWTEREVYLSLTPPMSALNNLPGLDAVVDRALEVAAEKEKVDKHDEALSAHLWLWNTAQTLPPTSHIYWKSAAALMRFEARLGGPEFPLGIWLDEHLRRVVCKRARNILDNAKFPKVRQKLQKVFDVYHVLIPQASTELVEDGFKWQPYGNLRAFVSATGTEASDIFNRTGLHHAVRSTSASANYHSWEAIPDLCQLWVRGDKWANRLSSQPPERWNPIGWEEDFTEAIADPTKWLRRLQRKKPILRIYSMFRSTAFLLNRSCAARRRIKTS